ncbi:hypothetical protein SAMN04488136_13134 [Vibrio xiamenensis]|uniref:NADH dehydrogenase n=1 Tax=Vibrio xiamenensis TaxID=861298 RepID=A0A1G8FLT1_9VIBR|nr:hypothetical protein [Vibrio xiamenensis]SDH83092.1 hypothetical protein SAMN04488136_13134 [Vibrio xiamenensis]
MLTRYMGMTPRSQSYLFTFGLLLTLLGMALTDMWLPMVAGAFILTGLTVEAWIRVAHIIPMHEELRSLRKQVDQLQRNQRQFTDQE